MLSLLGSCTYFLQLRYKILFVLFYYIHSELVVVDEVSCNVQFSRVILRCREVDSIFLLHILQVGKDVVVEVVEDAGVGIHRHVVQ